MTTKAFLGHSFTAEDKELVGNVIEFLDAQKVAHREFEWHHATQARATGVVEKVLPMIRESSIFIGLCTRKERVVSPKDLEPTLWTSKTLKVAADKVEWKTSDWIIQEIGVAIALGLRIILLIEDGVRVPGGLIGDLEYIPFQRNNLGSAFISLTQMLGDAIKEGGALSSVQRPSEDAGLTEEPKSSVRTDNGARKLPDRTWTFEDYESAVTIAIVLEDKSYFESVDSAFRGSSHASDPQMLRRWQATIELWRIFSDQGGDIAKLESLANQDRGDLEVLRMLAGAHGYVGNQDIGARIHEEGLAVARSKGDLLEQAKSCFRALIAYIKCGALDDARRILDQLLKIDSIEAAIELLKLDATIELAKHDGDKRLQITALERKVQIRPVDEDARFSLAYLYSETDDDESALLHYKAIPESKRSSASWNNLGVARERVKLNALAVESYRESEKQGGTLAMSNLAKQFLSAGFVSEAEQLCDRTMKIRNYDPAVLETLTSVKAKNRDELKQEEEIVLKTEPRSRFLRDAGRALVCETVLELSESFNSKDCSLAVTRSDNRLIFSGSYEKKPVGLGFLFGGTNSTPHKYEVKYEMIARGRTLFGTVFTKRIDKEETKSLFSDDKPTPVIMVIAEDQKTIRVMENEGKNSKIYEITA